MVLGTYAYLPAETFRNFSRTGTLHLLAASGYNCYILLFLATPIFKALRVTPRYTSILVILLIIVYVMMAGTMPSLMRAAIMSSLALLGAPLKRVPSAANSFFIAGLVLLAINPSELFDVGFQLSFLAIWSLIAVSPIIATMFRRAGLMAGDARRARTTRERILRKFAGGIAGTAVATIAVSLVTAPIIAYYFNYISLVSVPANAALEVGVPVVFAVGFISPLAAPVHWLGVIVGWVGTWTTRAMLATVDYFGSMTYSAVSVASPGILAIIGYYVILYGVVGYARARYAER
jgi:competence protein ComEC